VVVRVISLRPAWYVRKRSVEVAEKMRKTLRRLWEDSEGQDLVEYALIIILVSLLSVAAMKAALATPMERQRLNSTLLRSGEWPCLQVFRWPEG
jgi:Flp pilus assembly pilin Flp